MLPVLISLIIFSSSLKAECQPDYKDPVLNRWVYTTVEQMPEYQGDIPGFMRFINANYKFHKAGEWQSTFQLEFVIDEQGHLKAARIWNKKLNDISASEQEMLRVLSLCPKWQPGRCGSKKVAVHMLLRIILEPAEL